MTEESNRRTDRWHFEKRISLDTIVSIIGIAAVLGTPIFIWGRALEQAQAVTANRVTVLESLYQKQEADAKEQRTAMLQRMDDFNREVTQLRIEVAKLTVAIGSKVK